MVSAGEDTDSLILVNDSLRQCGIVLGAVHKPRLAIPILHVIVRVGGASLPRIIASIGSLLRSSCHDFVVDLADYDWADEDVLRGWLGNDSRFRLAKDEDGFAKPLGRYTLVIGAGTVLGTHSVAGFLDAIEQSGADVLRALVEGQRTAPELWVSERLTRLRQQGDPERLARHSRGERWMSGESLGMHDSLKQRPKQWLVKGTAGVPEVRLVIRDLNDAATRLDYEVQLRELHAKLRRAQIAARRDNGGLTLVQISRRAAAVFRLGPKYVAVKLRQRLPHKQG